jgi:hypothetical protein
LEEAFEALSRSWAMGLPRACFGKTARYVGWCYYVGSVHGDYVLPMFKFELNGEFPAYVPAVKSEYFADPQCQILSDEEWAEAKQKAKEPPPSPASPAR